MIYVLNHQSQLSITLSHNSIGAVPSLKGAAKQLNILKKELKLNKVFLASDAPEHGMNNNYDRVVS